MACTQQTQRHQQMIAIDRGDCRAVFVTGAIDQQRVPRCDGIAVHQPQVTIDIIAGDHRFIERAEQ